MEYEDWRPLLMERFPPRDAETGELEWERLKRTLMVGESVTGVVVARAPFGAWIDCGMGFPALLEIINITALTPEKYQSGDWCPVGSTVTAVVCGFRENNRQIDLCQDRSGEKGDG